MQAVEDVLKKMKRVLGAVALCAGFDQLHQKFCWAKLSHVEIVTWYIQGSVVLGRWSLFTSALAASVGQALAA